MTLTIFTRNSSFALFALGLSAAFVVPACVNNDPVEGGDGDGDGDGTGGGSSTGGTTGDGDGDGDAESCGNGENNDAHVAEMIGPVCVTSNIPNCNITDFTAASYDPVSGDWGDDMSLTGGTSPYSDMDSTISREVVSDSLNITASVSGNGYVGLALWFGPCTDATDFDGIKITLNGDLDDGGIFELQVNSDENYPLGEKDNFGSCDYTTPGPWDGDCSNNFFRFSGLNATSTAYYIPWSAFTGGKPVATLSPNQLGGVQLQAGCDEATAPCEINVTVHDIRFYRDHAPYLGMGGSGN